jgi:hypothetical protein
MATASRTAARLRHHGFAAAIQAHGRVLDRSCAARPGHGAALLIVVAAELGLTSDPNPNPIGPGLLAFFTFWPAVILIVWGLVASVLRYRRSASAGLSGHATRRATRASAGMLAQGGMTAVPRCLRRQFLSFSCALERRLFYPLD